MQYDSEPRGSVIDRPSVKHGLENTYNLRKVFALLLFQVVIGFLGWITVYLIPSAKTWIASQSSIFLGTIIAQALLPFLVYAARGAFRKPALGVLAYLLFALLLAFNLSYLVLSVNKYLPQVVVAQLFFIYFGLLLYTFASYSDLGYSNGALYIIGSVIVAYQTAVTMTDLEVSQLIITSLIMGVFGINLIFSSRLAVCRTHGQLTPPENPVVSSLTVYVYVFALILQVFYNFAKIFKNSRL